MAVRRGERLLGTSVRFTKRELRLVESASSACDESLSSFLRRTALATARAILQPSQAAPPSNVSARRADP